MANGALQILRDHAPQAASDGSRLDPFSAASLGPVHTFCIMFQTYKDLHKFSNSQDCQVETFFRPLPSVLSPAPSQQIGRELEAFNIGSKC